MSVLPAALLPSRREAPGLAWTTAHAFSALPLVRQHGAAGALRLFHSVWVIPMWLIVWVPVIGLRIPRGEVARRDRHAVVLIAAPGNVDWRTVCQLLLYGFAVAAAPVGLLTLLHATRPALAGGGVLLLLTPVVADAATMAWRVSRAGRGTAARGEKLRQNGQNVRIVSLYAAHPPHEGHGSALLEQLVGCAPADVWLLVAAADPQIAAHYRTAYDFRNWDPKQPLLLERPAVHW